LLSDFAAWPFILSAIVDLGMSYISAARRRLNVVSIESHQLQDEHGFLRGGGTFLWLRKCVVKLGGGDGGKSVRVDGVSGSMVDHVILFSIHSL
jgi:hypothetical protein